MRLNMSSSYDDSLQLFSSSPEVLNEIQCAKLRGWRGSCLNRLFGMFAYRRLEPTARGQEETQEKERLVEAGYGEEQGKEAH